MFDKIKNLFAKPEAPKSPEPTITIEPKLTVEPKPKAPRKPRTKKIVEEIKPNPTAKELATAAGKPFVEVLKFDMDPDDIHTGNFTIDYNDKFVLNLIRAGYKMKETDTDDDVVDRWFTQICRSIVLEEYEQVIAQPANRGADDRRPPVQERKLDDGKIEIS